MHKETPLCVGQVAIGKWHDGNSKINSIPLASVNFGGKIMN